MADADQPVRSTDPSDLTEAVSKLLRWELQGGVWRVLGRDADQVTIGLFTCDAGEEMERFSTADKQLLAVVEGRSGSEHGSAAQGS